MSARYTIEGPWEDQGTNGSFTTQAATLVDSQGGYRYDQGAWRVVNADGKPAVKGKGGTVPFKGETAWSHAAALCRDLAFKEMRES
jgi:hypothetical protein